MSMLEELYNGNIHPSERYVKHGSEYQKRSAQLTDYMDELLPLLNDKEKQLCEKIEDSMLGLCHIAEKENFIEGFRIGAQMMWDILHFKSENYL